MVSESGWPRAAMAQARAVRVALVDNGAGLGPELEDRLAGDGMELLRCAAGPELPGRLSRLGADLVLVNADRTGEDPVALLQTLAAPEAPPVVMVTDSPDDTTEMRTLAAGADAYLDLGEPPWKLCLRLQALQRRRLPEQVGDSRTLCRGPLRIDLDRREVHWRDHPVAVSATELSLLVSLARRPGHVRTRAQLMDAMHSDRLDVADRTIDSHVKRLRKKLRALDPHFSAIRTLYGVGYSFTA